MPATSPTPKHDPTPALARDVIDLYEQALAGVQFPDLDLSALQSTRHELAEAQVEVERVETELAAARELLESRIVTLNAKAERALAYARIFAQDNSELSAQIAEIGRKKPGQLQDGSEPKKRGRKKKSDAPSDLFTEHGTAAAEAALEADETEEDAYHARSLETQTDVDAEGESLTDAADAIDSTSFTAESEQQPTSRPQPTAAPIRRRSRAATREREAAPAPD